VHELDVYKKHRYRFYYSSRDTISFFYSDAVETLKAKSGWDNHPDGESSNGTDEHGFSALPGGLYYYGQYNPGFYHAGSEGSWWAADINTFYSYTWHIGTGGTMFAGQTGNLGTDGMSVRCVADP